MLEEIIVRKVQPSDFEGLVHLYEDVWPDVDYNKRKKADFVINQSKGIDYCAERGVQIVGSRTSFFQNMYYGHQKLNCVQCGDSCVHPSCQGKGLFQRMNKAFLKGFFIEQPGELVFNISVAASRRSYEKLGWNYIESLMKLTRLAQPLQTLIKLKLDIRKFKTAIIWEQENDVKQIDPLLINAREELLANLNLLHINYDDKTFYWRMKSESGIKSFFALGVGYVLYKIGHRGKLVEVEIGEIFLYEYTKKSFNTILKTFKKAFRPDILWVMVSEGHPLRQFYSSACFFANPKQKYLHHGVRVESDKMKKICYNPHNWAISSLDIDTF